MTSSTGENRKPEVIRLTEKSELRREVEAIVNRTQVIDIHTHLFAPAFGKLGRHYEKAQSKD
jgi:hypothetical protein